MLVVKISNDVPFFASHVYDWWFGNVHSENGLFDSAEEAKEDKQKDHDDEVNWNDDPGDGC